MEKGIYLCDEEKALIGTDKAKEIAKMYLELANKVAKNLMSVNELTFGKTEYLFKIIEVLKEAGVKNNIEDVGTVIEVCNCKAMALLGMIPAI